MLTTPGSVVPRRTKDQKREAKRRGLVRWLRFRLEYLAVRVASALFLAVRPETAFAWARGLGRLVYRFDLRHKKIGRENLDRVYGERLGPREKERILVRAYENMAAIWAELVWSERLVRPGAVFHVVDRDVLATIQTAIDHPRGAFMISGHMGNWEMGPFFFAELGYKFASVVRVQDNPLLDAYVSRLRRAPPNEVIPKHGALRGMMRFLGEPRRLVAVLMDQNSGSKGTFVDFLGTTASTTSAPILVAKKKRIPLVVLGCMRVAPMRFRFSVPDVISEEDVDRLEVDELVARVSAGLGKLVLEFPEQWIWIHRRWRSRPAVERSAPASE